jgi:hypothetical protein
MANLTHLQFLDLVDWARKSDRLKTMVETEHLSREEVSRRANAALPFDVGETALTKVYKALDLKSQANKGNGKRVSLFTVEKSFRELRGVVSELMSVLPETPALAELKRKVASIDAENPKPQDHAGH